MAFSTHSHSRQFCPSHAKDNLDEMVLRAISLKMSLIVLTVLIPCDQDKEGTSSDISKANLQQLVCYHHPRKIEVRKGFEYLQGTAKDFPTEMKHMCTSEPVSKELNLPELFRTAIQNSQL